MVPLIAHRSSEGIRGTNCGMLRADIVHDLLNNDASAIKEIMFAWSSNNRLYSYEEQPDEVLVSDGERLLDAKIAENGELQERKVTNPNALPKTQGYDAVLADVIDKNLDPKFASLWHSADAISVLLLMLQHRGHWRKSGAFTAAFLCGTMSSLYGGVSVSILQQCDTGLLLSQPFHSMGI